MWKKYAKVAVIGLALIGAFYAAYRIFWPASPRVTLPTGQTVTSTEIQGVKTQIMAELRTSSAKINDLESQVRQLNEKTTSQDIPQALAETSMTKSVERMLASWQR